MTKSIATFGIVALLSVASSASALVITGQGTTLPGGGSCSISGVTTTGSGATVTCTGIVLSGHSNVYFGIRNASTVNGNTMTNANATAGSAAVFRNSSTAASQISYTSTTTSTSLNGFGVDTVTSTLNLNRTVGTATVTATGGTPANSGNGDIGFLYKITAAGNFTLDVDILAQNPDFGLTQASNLYDAAHVSGGSGGGERSTVEVGFFWSDCGDSVIDSPEVCDDGAANGTGTSCCTTSCTFKTAGSSCTTAGGVTECSNADTCAGGSNTCLPNHIAAGTPCTDTSAPGTNDANQCKDAQCNGSGTCNQTQGNEANGTACAEGNFCSSGDTCQSGVCSAGAGNPCPGSDGDADCTETCVDTGFETGNCDGNDPNGSSCAGNGGGECSGADTCSSGVCANNDVVAGTPCTDSSPPSAGNCLDAQCNGTGTCNQNAANEANGTACADGDFCNGADQCTGGACTVHAGDPCDGPGDADSDCSETCVDTGYEAGNCNGTDPNGSSCTDGAFCTGTESCTAGTCGGSTGDPCEGADGDGNCSESCNEAADNCLAPDPNGSTCTDGLFCNGSDTCSSGACSAHTGDPCDGADGDGDCSETCDEGADNCLAPDPNGSSCTDGLFCNGTDTCSSGSCTAHAGDPCDGADGDGDCSETCDEGANNCNGSDPNGSTCTDGTFCNGTDTCSSGACTVHTGDPCEGPDGDGDCSESCSEANDNCLAADPNGSSCTDGLFCTGTDTCSSGACTGHTGDPCDGPDGDGDCSETCDEGADDCEGSDPNGSTCTDSIFCNGTDTCGSGTCSTHTGDPCDGPDGDLDCSETCNESGANCNGSDPDGTLCRSDTGECDVEETCDSGLCPADDFEPNGTACGSNTDTDCDNPDTCNGNNLCLTNFEPSLTACGDPSDTDCTNPDTCDGTGTCETNHEPNTVVCRPAGAGLECDAVENCDGAGSCPPDGVLAASTLCRGSAGFCDIAEECDGVDADCPADAFEPATTECRADTGECDLAENCTGTGALCPPDIFESSGTACGDPTDTDCNNPDTCDGSNNCQVNNEPAATTCTTDGETCTVDECDGGGTCTHDAGNSGTECRAAVDLCDEAEACDGTNPTCPGDAIKANGDVCRPDLGECDTGEVCDGVTTACPPDVSEPDGTTCGDPSDTDCTNPDSCLAGVCEGNHEPITVECRAASAGQACDAAENCDGAGNCPADAPAVAGTDCRASAGDCDLVDECDGSSFDCPADAKSTGVCRPSAGVCDLPDSCDGVGNNCPADLKSTAPCRPDAGICDVGESCDGVGNNCPTDLFEPNGTSCTDNQFCNGAETCQAGACTNGANPCPAFCEESTDMCLASSCATTPLATCRTAGKSLLLLKNKDDNTKDRLVWKWIKGAETTQLDFGNPTTTAYYGLCIYDSTGLVGTMDIPPDANKWSLVGTKGYKYSDDTAASNGAFKIKLKGGSAGKSKALVKGRGEQLMDPIDVNPLSLPVKVQLVNNSNGICFESNFATMKLNTTSKFKSKSP